MNHKLVDSFLSYIPYICILLLGITVFFIPIGNCDEFWTYSFAKNVYNGLTPYSDFNMVQTSGSVYVAVLFLKIFGCNMFSYRIASFVLMFGTFTIFYKLNYKMSKSKTVGFIVFMFVWSICVIVWIYNYNKLCLFIVLSVIYIVYQKERSSIREIILSLIIGTLPIIKQSTGSIVFIAYLITLVLDCKVYRDKATNLVKYILLTFVPFFLYLAFLLQNHSIDDFFEYAVLGLKYFSHRVTYFDFITKSWITVLLFFIPIYIIFKCIFRIIKEHRYDEKVKIFIIAMSWLSLAYPLCDLHHFFISIIPIIPCLFMFEGIRKFGYIEKVVCIIFSFVPVIFFSSIVVTNKETDKVCELNEYNGLPINTEYEKDIVIVCDYILEMEDKGYKVLIADESAAKYMITLNKYNKNWDMLLVGNIGTTTVGELLDNDENTLYLVMKDENVIGYQSHFELIESIKKKYKKIDEINQFDVYIK